MDEIIGKEESRKSFSEEARGRLLKEFEESQGTMSDFCRGKGIALTTFSGWLRRRKGEVPVLAEVKMEMPLSYQTLEIRFSNKSFHRSSSTTHFTLMFSNLIVLLQPLIQVFL